MAKLPHVAILVDTATSWGRGIIRGVRRYAHQRSPWLYYVHPWGHYDRFRLPRSWSGDGLIARVVKAKLAEEIRDSGYPAVNVSSTKSDGESSPTARPTS